MKTTKANKKVLVILAAMAAISGTTFAAGVNNTVTLTLLQSVHSTVLMNAQ